MKVRLRRSVSFSRNEAYGRGLVAQVIVRQHSPYLGGKDRRRVQQAGNYRPPWKLSRSSRGRFEERASLRAKSGSVSSFVAARAATEKIVA